MQSPKCSESKVVSGVKSLHILSCTVVERKRIKAAALESAGCVSSNMLLFQIYQLVQRCQPVCVSLVSRY